LPVTSRGLLEAKLNIPLSNGYVMHIGGNQYYKNRIGVIEIYDTWRKTYNSKTPLVMIGEKPSEELITLSQKSLFKEDIHFVTDLSDGDVNSAYSGASCLLFPSLDEGFGWPIIEAMASGCPVITTNKAPMNEIGGMAAYYIDKKPTNVSLLGKWKVEGANMLEKVLSLNTFQRNAAIEKIFDQSQKFTSEYCLNAIEAKYKEIKLIL
jgi:glycosyltransferase involved in cell wall biosynthesis